VVVVYLKTGCKTKPDIRPPGYATSRLRPATAVHYYNHNDPHVLLLSYDTAIWRMSLQLSCVHKANKNWLPWQRPSRDRKTVFGLIVYSIRSTSPEDPSGRF